MGNTWQGMRSQDKLAMRNKGLALAGIGPLLSVIQK